VFILPNFKQVLTRAPLLDEVKAVYPCKLFGIPDISTWIFSIAKCQPYTNELYRFLSQAEKKRLQSLRHMGRRTSYLAGHGLLRVLLSCVTADEISPDGWCFQVNRHGKPCLAMPCERKWKFNLSYTKEILAISLSQVHEIGLDIESVGTILPEKIPGSFLAPVEAVTLSALPEKEQAAYFLKIGTVKEAFSKCLGLGASLDYSALQIDFDPLRVSFTQPNGVLEQTPLLYQEEIRIGSEQLYLSIAAL